MGMIFVGGDVQASSLILQRLSVLKLAAFSGVPALSAVRPLTSSTRVASRELVPMDPQDGAQEQLRQKRKALDELKRQVQSLEDTVAREARSQEKAVAVVAICRSVTEQGKSGVLQQQKDALYDAKMRAITLFLKMNDTNNLFPRWNIVGTKLRENNVASLIDYLEKEGQVKFVKDFAVVQDAMKEGILFDASGRLRSYNVPDGEARDLLHTIELERNSDKFLNKWMTVDVAIDTLRSYTWYSMGRSDGRRENGAQHPDAAGSQTVTPADGIIDPLEPSAPSPLEKGSISSSEEELIDTAITQTSEDNAKELVDAAKISSDAPAEELSDKADSAASGVAEVSKGILESIGDFFSGIGD